MEHIPVHLSPNFEDMFSRIGIESEELGSQVDPRVANEQLSAKTSKLEQSQYCQAPVTHKKLEAAGKRSPSLQTQSHLASSKTPNASGQLPPPPHPHTRPLDKSLVTGPDSSCPASSLPSPTGKTSHRKQYPSHLYPNPPNLSTAKRAESRQRINSTTSKLLPPSLTYSMNHPIGTDPPTTRSKKDPKRFASLPHSSSTGTIGTSSVSDFSYSFMRGTTSSAKKRVNPPLRDSNSPTPGKSPRKVMDSCDYRNRLGSNGKQAGSKPTNAISNRVTSNPTNSKYGVTTQKSNYPKINNTDGLPSVVANKRQLTSKKAIETRDGRITSNQCNEIKEDQKPRQRLQPPALATPQFHQSQTKFEFPLKPNAKRNISSPSRGSEDVYSRLYNDSKKTTNNTTSTNTKRSTIVKSQSSKAINQVLKQDNINCDKKVKTLENLYSLILEKDPFVFQDNIEIETSQQSHFSEMKPLNCEDVIDSYAEKSLSVYERGEILRRKDIFFAGKQQGTGTSPRVINIKNYGENYGFDDKYGNYVIIHHDHINYRYEIEKVLGNGSFGNVVKCKDHKFYNEQENTYKLTAIKIIKSELNWSLQAVTEIKMLKYLNDNKKNYPEGADQILTYFDHFHFRGHMCISTEVLSYNLFSMIEMCDYKGFSIELVKNISRQILKGLNFIHKSNVIHCDIKPENIMAKFGSNKELIIKIIDFGSSCFNNEISFSYIQSRYYRAPEVILGIKYDNKIDVWSFGCVVAELFTGMPLLAGKSELEQIALILQLFGAPSAQFIVKNRKKLLKSVELQKQKLINPIDNGTNPHIINEKSINKTILFSLFDMDGKINLQILNMRLQSLKNQSSSIRRGIKLNSKMLDISLKLGQTNENKKDCLNLTKFLHSIFQWDPIVRKTCEELLNDPFLA